jgi:lysophospholipase L1-like esterase
MGDSFTEGVGDPDERCAGGLRGWADRVAEELSEERKDFAYANLAIRGLLLDQILDQQTEPALELKPDLITLSAGGNDMVFHRTDPDKLAAKLEAGVERLSGSGATIMLFAGPDWQHTLFLGRSRSRVAIFNENIRIVAAAHDCLLVDLWTLPRLREPRMWAPDRLHFSPLGHQTIAMQVLDTLQVQHSLQALEPKAMPHSNWRDARAGDLAWARDYFLPWAWQRIAMQRVPLPGVHDHAAPVPLMPKRPVFGPVYAVRTVAAKVASEFLA